jgi:hypothetical protein
MNIVEYTERFGRSYRVTTEPKRYVIVETLNVHKQLVDVRRFELADLAEYDSFNLKYVGNIVSIGNKTITVADKGGRRKRMKLEEFAWRNFDFDVEEIKRHNWETTQNI